MALSGAELDKFKKELLERYSALKEVSEAGAQAADTVELDQQKVGRVSRMDAMQAQAMSIETNRRREIELVRIETALQRIEEGDFGICVSCDEEIALARLHADPPTPICINCASQGES